VQQESGELRAGRVLLWVNGGLSAAGGVVVIVVGLLVIPAINHSMRSTQEHIPAWAGTLYVVLGFVSLVGSALSFIGASKSSRGEPGAAFGFGLAGALLPPVQVVGLVGAILIKVSPEGSGKPVPPPEAPPTWGPGPSNAPPEGPMTWQTEQAGQPWRKP
jgi:hypothetical protein